MKRSSKHSGISRRRGSEGRGGVEGEVGRRGWKDRGTGSSSRLTEPVKVLYLAELN